MGREFALNKPSSSNKETIVKDPQRSATIDKENEGVCKHKIPSARSLALTGLQ
jgi:hypothetical protein